MSEFTQLRETLWGARNLVVLTGAGVSTESGIPDFRTTDATWKHQVPREVAMSMDFFNRRPREFWDIYWDTFGGKLSARPNRFHHLLAALAGDPARTVNIITQNVDGLHAAAGSPSVLEYHGSMHHVRVGKRGDLVPLEDFPVGSHPQDDRGRFYRPDVVLFGEQVHSGGLAKRLVSQADVLLVAGTALLVHPFADLPELHRQKQPGGTRIWVGRDHAPAEGHPFAQVHVTELSHLVDNLAR